MAFIAKCEGSRKHPPLQHAISIVQLSQLELPETTLELLENGSYYRSSECPTPQ